MTYDRFPLTPFHLVSVIRLLGFGFMFPACVQAQEQTLPKWEIGVGPGFISYPDYPGSKEQNNLFIPFPYITYRGKTFSIDQREVKKPLYQFGNMALDMSLTGSIPVSSKDNARREGMDDLDTTVGIGPVLKYTLFKHQLNELKFEWPVYVALASDFSSIHQEGFTSRPGLYYYFRRGMSVYQRLKMSLYTTANFATATNHNYFYAVSASEARYWRPEYKTTGGYSGMTLGASLNWHFKKFWLGAFYKRTDLSQSVFKNSPLVETYLAETFGLAFTWNFYQSDETVKGLD